MLSSEDTGSARSDPERHVTTGTESSRESGGFVCGAPSPDLCSYRLDGMEKRLAQVEDAVKAIVRLRRDLAIATLVLLFALALSSPQVWGVVVGFLASARQAIKG